MRRRGVLRLECSIPVSAVASMRMKQRRHAHGVVRCMREMNDFAILSRVWLIGGSALCPDKRNSLLQGADGAEAAKYSCDRSDEQADA